MRVEMTYYAFDETEFDNEAECLAYEERLKQDLDGVIFFDENMQIMKNPPLHKIESHAFYMYIADGEKAESLFNWLYEQIYFCAPSFEVKTGEFLRTQDGDEWVDMVEEANELLRDVESLKSQIK